MSGPININMQEYENNSPLSPEKVRELLREDHEARRRHRCCRGVSRSVVYAILMAGIAYCIYDNHSLRKDIQMSISQTLNHTIPSCLYQTCSSPVTPTCPSSKSSLRVHAILLAKKMLDNDFAAVGIHAGSVYFRGKQTAKDHASARVSEAFLCASIKSK